jgi:hypothetical protein
VILDDIENNKFQKKQKMTSTIPKSGANGRVAGVLNEEDDRKQASKPSSMNEGQSNSITSSKKSTSMRKRIDDEEGGYDPMMNPYCIIIEIDDSPFVESFISHCELNNVDPSHDDDVSQDNDVSHDDDSYDSEFESTMQIEQHVYSLEEIFDARQKCKSKVEENMRKAKASDKEIAHVMTFIDSISAGDKVLILLFFCPTSISTGWIQISMAHGGVNNPSNFCRRSCCSTRVMDILYAPLLANGWKINEWNIRFNCKLKEDHSGCLPCSKSEGQETANQINAIASFAKRYLNVIIKVVSQGGRSTNVSKHCVSKLRCVDTILPNGHHISLPGYRNPCAFQTKELS